MTAILGGGNFVQGAAAAGLNELAAQQLVEHMPESELLQNLVAVTIGSAIGGQQGGLITGTADRYNRQLHPMEVEFLIDEERVERYRAYLQQQDPDRALTYEEAKRALVRYGTAYMDKSWALVFGRDDATEAFIQSEKQGLGLTYEDQYGQQHEFFDWSQESYENERINLKALFTEYGDNAAVKDYIKAIYNEAGQEDALERYRLGQLEGYKTASAEAHLGKDLMTLAEGVLSLPSDLIKTLIDNEFGPLDSEQMEVYYEALLKLQGRYEDAGYLTEYVHATTQRLTVLGLPASQAMGYALLSASKAVSIRIAAGEHKPVEVAGQQVGPGSKDADVAPASNKGAGVPLGSNHPLGADAIPRNGSRPLYGQGPGTVTCGHNACGMVLDTLGKLVDPARLISELPPRTGGINRIDVRNLFSKNGVSTGTFTGKGVDDLARYTSNGRPVVVRVTGENNFSHFVVVDGVTKRNGIDVVAVRDPIGSGQQYFSPTSTFGQHFTGEVIVPR